MNKTIKKTNNKREIIIFSLCIISLIYFTLLFSNTYFFNFQHLLIGVFQEILTIPFLIGLLVLLIFSIKDGLSNKFSFKHYSIWSLLILIIIIIITWGSFIIQ
jgi:hypothetical protein